MIPRQQRKQEYETGRAGQENQDCRVVELEWHFSTTISEIAHDCHCGLDNSWL